VSLTTAAAAGRLSPRSRCWLSGGCAGSKNATALIWYTSPSGSVRLPQGEDAVELTAVTEQPQVAEERGVVDVVQQVGAGQRLDGDEVDLGAGDDPALAESAEHHLEEITVVRYRAAAHLPITGDDLQLLRVVDLQPVVVVGRQAADRQRAGDGQSDVAGEQRGSERGSCWYACSTSSFHRTPASASAPSGAIEWIVFRDRFSINSPPTRLCPYMVCPWPRVATLIPRWRQ